MREQDAVKNAEFKFPTACRSLRGFSSRFLYTVCVLMCERVSVRAPNENPESKIHWTSNKRVKWKRRKPYYSWHVLARLLLSCFEIYLLLLLKSYLKQNEHFYYRSAPFSLAHSLPSLAQLACVFFSFNSLWIVLPLVRAVLMAFRNHSRFFRYKQISILFKLTKWTLISSMLLNRIQLIFEWNVFSSIYIVNGGLAFVRLFFNFFVLLLSPFNSDKSTLNGLIVA